MNQKRIDYFNSLKANLVNGCNSCGHTGWISTHATSSICTCLATFESYVEMDDAGIDREYWSLEWSDWRGDELVLGKVKEYVDNIRNAYKHGLGLVLHGGNGVGKTFLSSQILKSAMANGYSARFITLAELTALMRSKIDKPEDEKFYEDNVKNAEFLSIDNMGSEHRASSSYVPGEFDILARARRRNFFPTLITTNLSRGEFDNIYGPNISSLYSSCSAFLCVEGTDFRKQQGNNYSALLKESR